MGVQLSRHGCYCSVICWDVTRVSYHPAVNWLEGIGRRNLVMQDFDLSQWDSEVSHHPPRADSKALFAARLYQ